MQTDTPTITRPTVKPWVRAAVVVTYVAMVTVNALANALPINGRDTGEISDSYPNLFAPAGLTFSIWGVIYFLLGAHVLYQLGLFRTSGEAGQGETARVALLERVGVLFCLSSLANIAWILCWHYDFIGVCALLLVTMLVLLILITRTTLAADLSRRDLVFVRVPFSVYFGWLTVATIANITVWLVSIGWDGLGIAASTWAMVILAVGAAIGTTVILRDWDIPYGLVLVWAYFGIWMKHTSAAGFNGAYPAVEITAMVGVATFLFAVAAVALRRRVTCQPAVTRS